MEQIYLLIELFGQKLEPIGLLLNIFLGMGWIGTMILMSMVE